MQLYLVSHQLQLLMRKRRLRSKALKKHTYLYNSHQAIIKTFKQGLRIPSACHSELLAMAILSNHTQELLRIWSFLPRLLIIPLRRRDYQNRYLFKILHNSRLVPLKQTQMIHKKRLEKFKHLLLEKKLAHYNLQWVTLQLLLKHNLWFKR